MGLPVGPGPAGLAHRVLGDGRGGPGPRLRGARRAASTWSSRTTRTRSPSRRAPASGAMAHIWMHNEMLELGDEKMSKSIGNIAPLSDVLDRWPAEVVIAFFLTSHYRSKLPFTEERMAQAQAVVDRLANALRTLDEADRGAGRGGPRPGPLADRRGGPRPSSSGRSTTTSAPPRPSPRCSRWCAAPTAPRRRASPAPRSSARPAASSSSCSTCSGLGRIGAAAAAGGGARRGDVARPGAAGGARGPRLRRAPTRCGTASASLGFEVTDTAGGPRVDAA